MTDRTPNPLITALGIQYVRCNGGERVAVRPTLRLSGCAVHDSPATRSVQATINASARTRLDLALTDSDYTLLDDDGWAAADDVYITTAESTTRISGLAFDGLSVYSKQLINAGENTIVMVDLLAEDDAGWDDPGNIRLASERTLVPGDACRVLFDPVTQLWLVNDGLFSGDLITHDNALVTEDGDNVTVF